MDNKEAQIHQLITQNEKKAFELLYEEVFPSVKKYITNNSGIEADAYDAFQDALIYFYNLVRSGEYDPKYKVFGFIYKVSINRWLNKLKKHKKEDLKDGFSSQELAAYNIEKSYTYHPTGMAQQTIENLVEVIGEKCKEILILRICYNLMFEDVIIRMALNSEPAAKMLFKRCRKKLVEAVKKNASLEAQIRYNA